jgi:GT2 family glycosyltransferase
MESLSRQTRRDFEVIVVDNSGQGLVRQVLVRQDLVCRNQTGPGLRIVENARNAGFGGAVNQGWRASTAPYLATLNDDAVAHPGWLDAMLRALENRPDVGMCASQVRFFGEPRLDSAGMLIAGDGSSKQRGFGRPPENFPVAEETLFPSGSAALYRRALLEELGGFDDRFFLYCEDTDLGLRARWAGWKCLYVPEAAVEHRYSHTAGGASPMKAYYVERNRLYTAVKNFPARMLWRVPFAACARYFWHLVSLLGGLGKTGEYRDAGHDEWLLPFLVFRAHAVTLFHLPRLLRERRRIAAGRKLTPLEFRKLAKGHAISLREIASL